MSEKRVTNKLDIPTKEFIWLKVTYHFHIFHYRMPESVAIAAVTPFVPSPLTVKIAMIASLFQLGRAKEAEFLAKHMHEIEVKIVPPKAAISFKAFMRYRSPPAVESEEKGLDESGSYYPSRPHMREYALFQGNIEIYVESPLSLKECVEEALKNLRYLGSKDSIVTCLGIFPVDNVPENQCATKLKEGKPGIVVLLADFKQNVRIRDMKDLLPGSRDERAYEVVSYTVPGTIKTRGKSKLFQRQ